jgi:hypothetical protein
LAISVFGGFIKKAESYNFKTYDVRIAAIMCMFLSAVLWWIPILGPAVAGYVCGRKSGSMTKGAICALLVGALIVFVAWGLSQFVLSAGGYPEVPADEAASNLGGISGLIGAYLTAFFIPGTSSLALSKLGLVAVFGLVGGILSRQIRKETVDLIVTGAVESAIRPTARSMEMYRRNKSLGFKSFDDCIESQGMIVNDNPDSKRSEPSKTVNREKSTGTTVQTVTTTVSPSSTSTEDEAPNPFSDILDRSARKRNGPQ